MAHFNGAICGKPWEVIKNKNCQYYYHPESYIAILLYIDIEMLFIYTNVYIL